MRRRTSIITFILLLFLSGCAVGVGLQSQRGGAQQLAPPEEVTGTYTLVLYGGRHADDIETVAFLDKEGDGYVIEPYAPTFDYSVRQGVPAKQALDAAYHFISWHSDFSRAQLSRIVDPKGQIVGYEMRPLYMPFSYGFQDVLDIDYSFRGEKVFAYIHLIPPVERMRRDGIRNDLFD